MSAGTKADSEGTLVRPNQVNDQVNASLTNVRSSAISSRSGSAETDELYRGFG